MIPSPRIAVIDDEEDSVNAIRQSLESMDTSCLPVLVRAGVPSVNAPVRGIRLLFLDVHLVSGHQQGAALYDTNATILRQVIASDNGPYVLVIWTTHKQERDALLAHISEHYPEIPQPLASLVMAKEEFKVGSGFAMHKVAERIAELLLEHPQANALLYWENAIDLACGDLIGKIGSFVPRAKMFVGESNEKLERILTAIAQSAVGTTNVKSNELGAINDGLMPLLFDRLLHLPDKDGVLTEKWAKAISKPSADVQLEKSEQIDLNSMYHIALDTSGAIKLGARGAVYDLPAGPESLAPGYTMEELLCGYFPEKQVTGNLAVLGEKTNWCLIGLRAACDQAQPKTGMNRLLLAAKIDEPFDVTGVGPFKSSEAIYHTMPMINGGKAFKLILSFRYIIALTDKQLSELKLEPKWRLRDNMCSVIETQFATHASRPGLMKVGKP